MTRHIKRLFLVLLFLGCSVSQAWAATLYLRDDAVNWTDAASWSNVSAADNTNSGPPTASDTCIAELLSSNVTISATSTCGSFSTTAGTGSWGGTLTHNAFVWTVAGNITFNSEMTYTPLATSTVTLSANNTLTSAGKLFPLMILNTGITTTLGDNLSFMASKVITLTLNGNSLDINGKTVSGNSAVNRLLIRSNTLGTARTITTTTGTFDAADFRDITASTAIDLSAVTNYSGDAGGNTNITFTTAATQTYTGGTGNWSTGASWTSRVPLPQDNVSMSGVTGGTITADMPRLGKSINWTGASGTPTYTQSLATTMYGSLTLISTISGTYGGTGITLEGRGVFTYTSAGKTTTAITMSMLGGTLTLQDAMSITSGSGFVHNNGTFTTGGFSVSADTFSSTNSNTRAINLGASTVTLTRTGSTTSIWNLLTTTGLTFNAGTSTILFPSTGSTAYTFAGGGLTYNNFTITGSGTGAVVLTGANIFNTLTIGSPKTVTFPSATTTTLSSLVANGSSGNVITINSSTGASAATLSDSSGENNCKWCSIQDSTAAGGALWTAMNSTNVSNNSVWRWQKKVSVGN